MKAKEEEKEAAPFVYRSYGKSELASLYLPHILPGSAMKAFNEWIIAFPGLTARLQATGFMRNAKRYTPAQVRMIVEAIGEP
ncbi:MAG: DUF4248 domain-containing protein [Bacteroides sp.]